MQAWLMGAALALLAGQGFAAEDEAARVLDYIGGEMLGADLAEGMRAEVLLELVDLNGDGSNEALVYIYGSSWCGSGGCNLFVLRAAGESYEEMAMMTVAKPPIGVLETSTDGWRDLFVSVGGGGVEPGARRMRYNGETYPRNPTTKGEVIDAAGATVLIGLDDKGTMLEPVAVE